jgi:hypothetical protein
LASLRNLGIVAHPRTIKASMQVSSASHLDRVKEFFKTVIENEQFIVFCIDDYHNMCTKHRPEDKIQTQSFLGNSPVQFFMRQLMYNTVLVSLPTVCKNVVPIVGPLHISLNSRECVLLQFHGIFADLYSFLFGEKAKLAKKPKPWRVYPSSLRSYMEV